jgi:hypothetical protein
VCPRGCQAFKRALRVRQGEIWFEGEDSTSW